MGLDLNLPSNVETEQEQDVLGGGSVLDSGIYKGTLEMVYLDAAPSGAKRINIHFNRNGQVYKDTIYISNKAGEFTYLNKQSGKPTPLPGYSQMDSFFKTATGKGLGEQDTVKKTIKIYDFGSSSDKNVEVDTFKDVLNKKVAIGVMKISKEKTTKESNYKDGTGEFRDVNEFVKFFDGDSGLTNSEKSSGKTSPDFFMKWKDKYSGVTKVEKAENTGAASGSSSTTSTGAVSGAPVPPPAQDLFA